MVDVDICYAADEVLVCDLERGRGGEARQAPYLQWSCQVQESMTGLRQHSTPAKHHKQ